MPASPRAPMEAHAGITRAELGIGAAVLVCGWICAAALSSSGTIVAPRPGGGYALLPWTARFAQQLVTYGWWLPIGACVALAVRRTADIRWPAAVKVASHILLLVASVSLYTWAQRHGTSTFSPFGTRRLVTYDFSSAPATAMRRAVRTGASNTATVRPHRAARFDFSGYAPGIALHIVTAGLTLLGDATRRRRVHERVAARLAREAEELRVSLMDAQLRALRMQLNPHFLYNTLNSIAALVVIDPPLAQRMIARLGHLLRGTLDGGHVSKVTCARELEWLEEYLDLQQLRFGESLEVSLSVAPEALAAMVPFLILQPLVENALEHGVSEVLHAGRIDVLVERRGDRLFLQVRDNGAGLSSPQADGIGLRNTRDRLRATYHGDFRLELDSAPGSGTVATIEIPFERN